MAQFSSIEEATQTRNDLFGAIWPQGNRAPPLLIDFITEDDAKALQGLAPSQQPSIALQLREER